MPQIGDLLAQITGEAPKPTATTVAPQTAPPKRKADSELPRGADKVIKCDTPSSSQARPNAPQRPSSGAFSTSKPLLSKLGSKPATTASANTSAQRSGSAGPKLESTSSSGPPAKPPKKGSFAEIMARAKQAQEMNAQVGKIQHKPVLTRKEREELSGATKNMSIKGKPLSRTGSGTSKTATPPLRDGRNGSRENGKKSRTASAEPEKKVKKAALATTGYAGTARPAGGAAPKKSAAPSYGSSSRDRDRDRAPSSSRYRYASEEEEEEDDYESDASSAMEAGLYDVDEEEERALRIARKEDQLAKQEEDRHREEKRRRLAAMAKSRR